MDYNAVWNCESLSAVFGKHIASTSSHYEGIIFVIHGRKSVDSYAVNCCI
jgi:hypothetical protein